MGECCLVSPYFCKTHALLMPSPAPLAQSPIPKSTTPFTMVVLAPTSKIDLGAVWAADPLFVTLSPGLNDKQLSTEITITNSGFYPVPFLATSNVEWMHVSPTNGTISPGRSQVLQLTVVIREVVNGTLVATRARDGGAALLVSGQFVEYGSCFRPLFVPVVIDFPGLHRPVLFLG